MYAFEKLHKDVEEMKDKMYELKVEINDFNKEMQKFKEDMKESKQAIMDINRIINMMANSTLANNKTVKHPNHF